MPTKFAAACGLALLASAASAQVPPDIAAQIRAGGQAMDPVASGALYTPLFANETYDDIVVTRDVSYGSDPQQKLDIYEPVSTEAPATVLVFVHGGGFTRGDKHGPFYPDNITAWAARGGGMIGVNVNYRLAPGSTYPGAAQDLAAAIAWIRANIAQHGGDPNRIVLVGHSAGANHVIDYIGHEASQGDEAFGVKGAVLISPNYASEMPAEPNGYYGADRDAQLRAAMIERLRKSGVPLFIAYAEFDPDPMRQTAQDMIDTLCAKPKTCPASIELSDHNHYTEGMAVGTDDISLTEPLLQWIEALR
jgi:triacylglycerol lipase